MTSSHGFSGFLAGVLGGAYGMNGPPLAIYGPQRRWTPEFFRPRCKATFCQQASPA